MSTRQSDRAKDRWSAVAPDDRRGATAPAVSRSVERRRRAFDVFHAFEDALEASGYALVPVDEGGEP